MSSQRTPKAEKECRNLFLQVSRPSHALIASHAAAAEPAALLWQGEKLSSPGSDPFGLGTNPSYSGYGLVFESSQESSFSSSGGSLLPPVPSLPGLAAPDRAGSSYTHQLKLVRGSARAGNSVLPVQHWAWQQAKTSPQRQGADLLDAVMSTSKVQQACRIHHASVGGHISALYIDT